MMYTLAVLMKYFCTFSLFHMKHKKMYSAGDRVLRDVFALLERDVLYRGGVPNWLNSLILYSHSCLLLIVYITFHFQSFGRVTPSIVVDLQ
jgi:hypothetical protein